jgi:AcrR family transcriptional regulator
VVASLQNTPGRPRDPDIDTAVLDVTRRHLAAHGYDAMSVVAVADDAGTTRQAVYRRWPTKADLATAAIASMSQAASRPDTDDPYRDLVAELTAFRQGVTRPNGIGMVGTMLQESVDPELRELYVQRIVAPRRRRLRHIMQRAADMGQLDPDADLDYATAACTGILYSLHLGGTRTGKDWSRRTANLVWRAAGGDPTVHVSSVAVNNGADARIE